MAAAAVDVAEIRTTISDATAAAAAQTTAVEAAGADQVSVAATAVFNAYARAYQALAHQAATFHSEFARALGAAASAYAEAEAAGAALTSGLSGAAPAYATTSMAQAATPQNVTLIMGGTGNPTPGPSFITNIFTKYVAPDFAGFSLADAHALFTPENLYPFTGVKTLPLNQSIGQGVGNLNDAVLQQISVGNNVVVVGYSQSAVISSLEMQALAAMPNPPSPSQLSFVLLGDPMNPNGGMMERFVGLKLASLGVDFYGATPTNTPYPTHIYTIEYDGFADFPRYPLDVLADLNALAGIPAAHAQYQYVPAGRVDTAITLPTDPAYGTATTYSMIPTTNLPLLDPVRAVPVIGNPIADLLQPDLTYLVNWGYGDPAYGYSTGPANVPTPFGLFPPLSATTALGGDLVTGTQQGIAACARDIGATRLPTLPDIAHAITSTPALTVHVPSGPSLFSALNQATSAGYATLLPTADITAALVTSVPVYDAGLVFGGVAQALGGDPVGLLNAIGNPIAADAALVTLAGWLETIAIANSAQSIALALGQL